MFEIPRKIPGLVGLVGLVGSFVKLSCACARARACTYEDRKQPNQPNQPNQLKKKLKQINHLEGWGLVGFEFLEGSEPNQPNQATQPGPSLHPPSGALGFWLLRSWDDMLRLRKTTKEAQANAGAGCRPFQKTERST